MEPTKIHENEKALIWTILSSNAKLSDETITELVEKDVYVYHYRKQARKLHATLVVWR